MNNSNIFTLALLAALFTLGSCSDDDELNPTSVFEDVTTEEKTAFDLWLEKNYLDTYNIDFKYRYSDRESDLSYNVIPADIEKSKGLAILVKHMWLDVYAEAVGVEFVKTYVPRIIQLTGSYKWNSNGSQVLGTAEGGLKVMLYGVNELDLDNARVNTENPYESKYTKPLDMNYWFFHTMHHEFCHILTQKVDYDPSFRSISASTYHATDWVNLEDKNVAKEGFVTAYGSGEYNEDFAEIYATYVTNSAAGWQKIIDAAGEEGAFILNQKLDIVKDYFSATWGYELDSLRSIVIEHSSKVPSINLRVLPE